MILGHTWVFFWAKSLVGMICLVWASGRPMLSDAQHMSLDQRMLIKKARIDSFL